ncbi:hypothetical protein [Nitrosomonas marina]|uniref:Phage tail assembly chaperone n=1 Tax=Nitrosomonas marina TaxID=917 RepID=A0A1H8GHN1_9PROT|nr:hypothetical protein [Nitrosomonas marina]SEN43300.1 hypothetical protein SAMN05216325_11821 [Nitrosomonas marina]
MAFKISKKPTFMARVEVDTPNHKGGHDRSTFMAEFARSNTEELLELNELKPSDLMRRKLVGWADFLDDDNQPVEFNPDTLESLLAVPEALAALRIAFWKSVVKGREKN